jgi:hypothetical protein
MAILRIKVDGKIWGHFKVAEEWRIIGERLMVRSAPG